MDVKNIIRKYELMIGESATSEEEEDRLLMILDYIDDMFRYLDREIERQEELQETVDYEKTNEDFVYQNCLPNNVFNIDDYRR